LRILLDENLDWRLRRDLASHAVESVPLIAWAGLNNGELLAEASKRFDVLLTMDSAMAHQQDLTRFRIVVIALKAPSNRLSDTQPIDGKSPGPSSDAPTRNADPGFIRLSLAAIADANDRKIASRTSLPQRYKIACPKPEPFVSSFRH
jgi:hypothetical protein